MYEHSHACLCCPDFVTINDYNQGHICTNMNHVVCTQSPFSSDSIYKLPFYASLSDYEVSFSQQMCIETSHRLLMKHLQLKLK